MKDLVCVNRLTIYIIYIIGVFIRINLVDNMHQKMSYWVHSSCEPNSQFSGDRHWLHNYVHQTTVQTTVQTSADHKNERLFVFILKGCYWDHCWILSFLFVVLWVWFFVFCFCLFVVCLFVYCLFVCLFGCFFWGGPL